jgi:hypothetical protein
LQHYNKLNTDLDGHGRVVMVHGERLEDLEKVQEKHEAKISAQKLAHQHLEERAGQGFGIHDDYFESVFGLNIFGLTLKISKKLWKYLK